MSKVVIIAILVSIVVVGLILLYYLNKNEETKIEESSEPTSSKTKKEKSENTPPTFDEKFELKKAALKVIESISVDDYKTIFYNYDPEKIKNTLKKFCLDEANIKKALEEYDTNEKMESNKDKEPIKFVLSIVNNLETIDIAYKNNLKFNEIINKIKNREEFKKDLYTKPIDENKKANIIEVVVYKLFDELITKEFEDAARSDLKLNQEELNSFFGAKKIIQYISDNDFLELIYSNAANSKEFNKDVERVGLGKSSIEKFAKTFSGKEMREEKLGKFIIGFVTKLRNEDYEKRKKSILVPIIGIIKENPEFTNEKYTKCIDLHEKTNLIQIVVYEILDLYEEEIQKKEIFDFLKVSRENPSQAESTVIPMLLRVIKVINVVSNEEFKQIFDLSSDEEVIEKLQSVGLDKTSINKFLDVNTIEDLDEEWNSEVVVFGRIIVNKVENDNYPDQENETAKLIIDRIGETPEFKNDAYTTPVDKDKRFNIVQIVINELFDLNKKMQTPSTDAEGQGESGKESPTGDVPPTTVESTTKTEVKEEPRTEEKVGEGQEDLVKGSPTCNVPPTTTEPTTPPSTTKTGVKEEPRTEEKVGEGQEDLVKGSPTCNVPPTTTEPTTPPSTTKTGVKEEPRTEEKVGEGQEDPVKESPTCNVPPTTTEPTQIPLSPSSPPPPLPAIPLPPSI